MNSNNDIVPGFDAEKNESLKIRLQTIDELPSALVLHLSGHIDTFNCHWFQRQVVKAIETGFIYLVFELGGYNMVSSVDIGSFCAFLKALKPRGGDLALVQMKPLVFECYALFGFAYFFNIMDTVDRAVGYFKQPGPLPKVLRCSCCAEWLEASRAGTVRCSKCGTTLLINSAGKVSNVTFPEKNPVREQTQGPTSQVTVMLVNIIDYVSLCERTLDVFTLLNQHYFKPIHEWIVEYTGTIGEMIGDRQTAYWTGQSGEENALFACRAAIKLTNAIMKDNLSIPREQRFRVNIGIASGKVALPATTPLMETPVADSLALAFQGSLAQTTGRLVDLGKSASKRILLDHETYSQIADRLKVEQIETEASIDSPVYALLAVRG